MFKKITVLIITLLLFSFCVINSFAEGEPDDTGTPAETEETGSEIPPHDHDPMLVPGSEPFCETTGVKPHFACSICGEMWADPGMTEPLTESDVIIPALGHDWGEWITVNPATATEPGEYYCTVMDNNNVLVTSQTVTVYDALPASYSSLPAKEAVTVALPSPSASANSPLCASTAAKSSGVAVEE
jgi:hypothetical protein